MEYNNKYLINIFERYSDLKKSNKQDFDNCDLWKIFEYYSCLKLSEEERSKSKYYCDVCDKVFFSSLYHDSHMKGIKHKNLVKLYEYNNNLNKSINL